MAAFTRDLDGDLGLRGLGGFVTARLIPARHPNGNSELAPQESNYRLSGKATSCKDFGIDTQQPPFITRFMQLA